MKNTINKAVTLFFIFIFSLNISSLPGSIYFEKLELNTINYNTQSNFYNLLIDIFNNYKNPPLALYEDPIEIYNIIENAQEIVMTPLAGLSLLLSHKFEKITLLSSEIFELGMHRNIHKYHPFNNEEGINFFNSLIDDLLENALEDLAEDEVKNYFVSFYEKISNKKSKTEIKSVVNNIFNEKFNNKTIFISRLLEEEQENIEKNILVIKEWINNNNILIATTTISSTRERLINEMKNFDIILHKSAKFDIFYLIIKNK